MIDKFEDGLRVFGEMTSKDRAEKVGAMVSTGGFGARYYELAVEIAFGDVWSRAGLLAQVRKVLTRQKCTPNKTLVVYEAGPCGYGWARYLNANGWRCEVISPAHVVRSAAGKAIKTDRRDALLLARESRAGNLTQIAVPDERDEAIRDLSRAREYAIAALLRARQQLKAMMLRHGRSYTGNTWTLAHERTLASVRFEHPAQQIASTSTARA